MLAWVERLWKEEEGQGMAEYGLILALVAVVCAVTLVALGDTISNKFTEVSGKLTPPTTPPSQ